MHSIGTAHNESLNLVTLSVQQMIQPCPVLRPGIPDNTLKFFAISAEDAFAVLESMAKIHGSIDKLQKLSMSDNEQMDVVEAKEIARKREAKNFQFSMCNINVGEEIVFVGCTKNAKDNDKYGTHVVIANDKQVEYDDKLWSLSALAKELGGNYAYGAGNFEYKEENLNAIRARLGK